MTTLVARPGDPRPEEVSGHKKSLGWNRGSTKKGGTRMNSASVAHRPLETPQESVPKKGPWAVGHESDERIAIIADALNLFDDGRSRSDADTAIRTQVATRAYVKSRFDGPYAHADAVARHRAVAAAQAKAADYRESLSEADRHLVMLIALRSLDTYHESLEGCHGPPGGDTRTWQAMDAARQSVVRADLEHAWYHLVHYDRSGALTGRQVFCPSCYAQARIDAEARGASLPRLLPGRATSNPTARVVVRRIDAPAQIQDYERRGACDRCGPHAVGEVG